MQVRVEFALSVWMVLIVTGTTFQILYMNCPNGNIGVLSKGPMFTVPSRVENFGQLEKILSSILGLKVSGHW